MRGALQQGHQRHRQAGGRHETSLLQLGYERLGGRDASRLGRMKHVIAAERGHIPHHHVTGIAPASPEYFL